jgi:hypothetical protein
MHTVTKTAAALAGIAATILLSASSCDSQPSAADKARAARNQGVEQIRAQQPVQAMTYSPTLDTINGWAKTWGTPGKVSYVYMQRADGTFAGYYVMKGLPVSYCASGSPTYDLIDTPGDGSNEKNQQVPAAGLDGAYYGGSGNCDRYYGFDAVTNQYLEYTDGLVLTAVLSDQPLSLDRQPRPFASSIAEVKAHHQ